MIIIRVSLKIMFNDYAKVQNFRHLHRYLFEVHIEIMIEYKFDP